MFVPIVVNILIIDLTIMPYDLKIGFSWRLGGYIVMDALILWHYRERMLQIWKAAWGTRASLSFSWRKWLMLPVVVVVLDFVPMILKIVFSILVDPSIALDFFNYVTDFVSKLL